ncbi:beta-galactosidase 17, partial [Tanacetum coccineum]
MAEKGVIEEDEFYSPRATEPRAASHGVQKSQSCKRDFQHHPTIVHASRISGSVNLPISIAHNKFTNFGFYNGANAAQESDYTADLTSYDYDAPISESGDVDGAKFKALRAVIGKYSAATLPPVPLNNEKTGYGRIKLEKKASLFDTLDSDLSTKAIESENPISMEAAGQMFGFLLYASEYTSKGNGNTLSIPKVHDRAQVYVTCLSEDRRARPEYIGTIDRWSNKHVNLPNAECASRSRLLILVENMGRINYGQYMFDSKGILSAVYLDGKPLLKWKMLPIPLGNLNESPKISPVFKKLYSDLIRVSTRKSLKSNL